MYTFLIKGNKIELEDEIYKVNFKNKGYFKKEFFSLCREFRVFYLHIMFILLYTLFNQE